MSPLVEAHRQTGQGTPGVLRHRHHDQPPAVAENAAALAQHDGNLRRVEKLEGEGEEHGVEGGRRIGKAGRVSELEFDAPGQPGPPKAPPGDPEHALGKVEPAHPAARADSLGQLDQRRACAGADLQHGLARPRREQAEAGLTSRALGPAGQKVVPTAEPVIGATSLILGPPHAADLPGLLVHGHPLRLHHTGWPGASGEVSSRRGIT